MAETDKIDERTPLHLRDLREVMVHSFNLKGAANAKPFLHVPPGYTVHDAEKFLQQPVRKRGQAAFDDLDSFATYINEQKNGTSRAFVTTAGLISVIFDFHGKDTAGWCENSAVFRPTFDPAWERWSRVNGQPMTQAALVEFLERNFTDIVDPVGAAVLELAENLSAKVNARFDSKLGVSDGRTRLLFEEDIEVRGGSKSVTTGEMELPRSLLVRFPIFLGGPAQDYPWRLRPIVANRQLGFRLDFVQAPEAVLHALELNEERFAEKTELKPFRGSFTALRL